MLRDVLLPLRGGIEVAFIYGSAAAGRETAASDIDVMILGRRVSLGDVEAAFADAQHDLGREVNPWVYRPEEFCRKLSEGQHFLASVVAGPKVFLIGDDHELAGLAKFGWVRPHQTSRQEIADLLDVADRDLEACQTAGLVADWRFNIAYNAALQLATAALAATGFRAERSNHHFRVIHSLEFTVGADTKTLRKIDLFRKKRNVADYERAETVSDLEADEMRSLARRPAIHGPCKDAEEIPPILALTPASANGR